MKTIFRAAAPTSTFIKSISVLMLVLLVTFAVTSCENQPKTTSTFQSEVVPESLVTNAVAEIGKDTLLLDIGDNAKIENRNLCIGGNGPGSTAPRNLFKVNLSGKNFEIGGNTAERKLFVIGGSQAPPRQFSETGSSPTMFKNMPEINGKQTSIKQVVIGGDYTPRKLTAIGGTQSAPRQLSGSGGTTDLTGSNEIGGQYGPRG